MTGSFKVKINYKVISSSDTSGQFTVEGLSSGIEHLIVSASDIGSEAQETITLTVSPLLAAENRIGEMIQW